MADQQQRGRIRELDGWRGISILLVILDHVLIFAYPEAVGRFKFLSRMAGGFGELGVDTFFVISGFVITRLLIKEEHRDGAISLRTFYTRRVFRILPVFLLLVSVICLLSWLGITPISPNAVLIAVFFLKDLSHMSPDWFLGHTWSLAVEEQFYIVFPLFWTVAAARRRPAILGVSLTCFLVWGLLVEWNMLTGLLSRSAIVGFSCINLGALLAIFESRARELMARTPPLVPLLVAAFLFLRPVPNTSLGRTFYHPFVPFGVGLLLAYTMSRKGWASALLNSAILQWVGLVSYSAYLWQELFIGNASYYGSSVAASAFHLALPAIFLVAAVSYYGVERPCTWLGRRFSGRESSSKAASELVSS